MPLEMHNLQSEDTQRCFALAIIAQSPAVAWIQDGAGRLVFMNEAHQKLMGTSQESIGKSVFDVFPAEIAVEYRQNDEQVLVTKRAITTIENAVDLHGNKTTYKVIKFPLNIGDEWMVGGFALDISDRETQHQDQLQHERSKAKLTVQSIIEAQEAERDHLSQLLRDGINQTLASCKLMLEIGGQAINPYVQRSYNYIEKAIKELGEISASLNGSVIEEVGLLPAIYSLLAHANPALELDTELQEHELLIMPPKLQLGVYRIMQSVSQLTTKYSTREDGKVKMLLQNQNLLILIEVWQKEDWTKLALDQEFRNINNQVDYLNGIVSFDANDLLFIIPVNGQFASI